MLHYHVVKGNINKNYNSEGNIWKNMPWKLQLNGYRYSSQKSTKNKKIRKGYEYIITDIHTVR